MSLQHALTFEDATVVGLVTTPTEDEQPRGEVQIKVGLTPAIADEFGIRNLLYNDNDTFRSVWTSIALDTAFTDVRVNTPSKHDGANLSLTPKVISGFIVKRNKAGAVKLGFSVKNEGYASVLADFVTAVGTAPFRLEIEPLQQSMDFDGDQPEQTEDTEGTASEASAETEATTVEEPIDNPVPWEEAPNDVPPEPRVVKINDPVRDMQERKLQEKLDRDRLDSLKSKIQDVVGPVKWNQIDLAAERHPEIRDIVIEAKSLRDKLNFAQGIREIESAKQRIGVQ